MRSRRLPLHQARKLNVPPKRNPSSSPYSLKRTISHCSAFRQNITPQSSQHIELITDYLTSPAQTHIGRLYSLDPGDAIESIASRPLGDFLLALGGPGTGKSLIGLYRMRRLLRERSTESLFDTRRPFFRFLSYTNTLVNTSEKMFESIAPRNPSDFVTRFSTFDKMVANGLEWFGIKLRPPLSGRRLEDFLDSQVLAPMKRGSEQEGAAASYVEDRLGPAFLMEEITELIEANGIETLTQNCTAKGSTGSRLDCLYPIPPTVRGRGSIYLGRKAPQVLQTLPECSRIRPSC